MEVISAPYLLEVIVCSVEDALAAERGGANRLEIISRYDVGGLTPSVELVRQIAETVGIPLRVMVRQTEAFVVDDENEKQRLCDLAGEFAEIGIDGIVLGFLKDEGPNKSIDHELVARVLACAPNLNATFHRAFEELADPLQAIAELKNHPQLDRILTSGGCDAWQDKVQRFANWQQAAQPEIQILVGGGTDAVAIKLLKTATGVREFHVGRAVREGESVAGRVLSERVRELKNLFDKSLV